MFILFMCQSTLTWKPYRNAPGHSVYAQWTESCRSAHNLIILLQGFIRIPQELYARLGNCPRGRFSQDFMDVGYFTHAGLFAEIQLGFGFHQKDTA